MSRYLFMFKLLLSLGLGFWVLHLLELNPDLSMKKVFTKIFNERTILKEEIQIIEV